MSFTAKEVADLKKLVAPKGKTFKYSYKNQGCEIERELTADELKDWHERIDALPEPTDPLCMKVGRDEIHWGQGTIVCAAAAGSYTVSLSNLWVAAPTKIMLFTSLGAENHNNFATSNLVGRLNAVNVNFTFGNRTDGAGLFIYQISAVAQNVFMGVMAVMER